MRRSKPPTIGRVERRSRHDHVQDFSAVTGAGRSASFGSGRQTGGLTEHIEKELAEVRAKPDDLVEWVDVITLAIDGYLRHGGSPTTLVADLGRKLEENIARALARSRAAASMRSSRTRRG